MDGWEGGNRGDGVCNVRCNTWPSEEDDRMEKWGGGGGGHDERTEVDDTS